jgi:hypothetical protein
MLRKLHSLLRQAGGNASRFEEKNLEVDDFSRSKNDEIMFDGKGARG